MDITSEIDLDECFFIQTALSKAWEFVKAGGQPDKEITRHDESSFTYAYIDGDEELGFSKYPSHVQILGHFQQGRYRGLLVKVNAAFDGEPVWAVEWANELLLSFDLDNDEGRYGLEVFTTEQEGQDAWAICPFRP
ncbi:hypothetical protein GTB64_004536 [Salmonella enterica]|nr:hypothetical protein [Salmonella enterica]